MILHKHIKTVFFFIVSANWVRHLSHLPHSMNIVAYIKYQDELEFVISVFFKLRHNIH